jgi:hypothetical protein
MLCQQVGKKDVLGAFRHFCFVLCQCHHMSLMDFVVSPPGCGRSVINFWGWDANEALLRCPDEVDGDTWIWSARRGLNLSSTKLPSPWWESSPSRKNPHGRTGNRTRDLMISSKKLRPLDHEAGLLSDIHTYISMAVQVVWSKAMSSPLQLISSVWQVHRDISLIPLLAWLPSRNWRLSASSPLLCQVVVFARHCEASWEMEKIIGC